MIALLALGVGLLVGFAVSRWADATERKHLTRMLDEAIRLALSGRPGLLGPLYCPYCRSSKKNEATR